MEWEDADLLSVDRALMDYAAGEAEREEWMREEKDVRVKALWVHPIKVSLPAPECAAVIDDIAELSRCLCAKVCCDVSGPSGTLFQLAALESKLTSPSMTVNGQSAKWRRHKCVLHESFLR